MALRRLAQENNALGSPRSPDVGALPPQTPRSRLSYGIHRSPADGPSLSASVPFDWAAARSRAPPPYATPSRSKPRKSTIVGVTGAPRKAVIRKKGLLQKIKDVPSTIAFELALFPHNVPLPSPKIMARAIGGLMHFLNVCIQTSGDYDNEWGEPTPRSTTWFDWTTPVTLVLIAGSVFNVYRLYTQTRSYKFYERYELLNSPNAKFVNKSLDLEPLAQPSLGSRIRSNAWFAFSVSWRFLLGFQPPTRSSSPKERTSRIQELNVWSPNDLELELFSVYSPVHALLWLTIGSSNWFMILLVMALVSLQTNSLVVAYSQLLKDKQILASESMKEYNEKFVYPSVNPVRRDVAVMTHESEVVNVWER